MINPQDPLAELLIRDPRYKFDAYVFVFEALRYAQDTLGMGQEESCSEDFEEVEQVEQHISGGQLCEAIRDYALEQYGLLAERVLNTWGVTSTGDFGEIVFNLIEIGKMKKTEGDRREDFDDVFDFTEGLHDAFQICQPDSSEEHRS